MANFDYTDFYILFPGHPKFRDVEIIEDEILRIVIQKYLTIIYTNKGELYGDPNFGADLERYLHQTKVNNEFIKEKIDEQISLYIPELIQIGYDLNISFSKHPTEFSDIMLIDFKVGEFEVNSFFA